MNDRDVFGWCFRNGNKTSHIQSNVKEDVVVVKQVVSVVVAEMNERTNEWIRKNVIKLDNKLLRK